MHKFRLNHIKGSRRNIAQHYDLNNDFFSLFLDKNMMYSSAIFPDENSDLETGSNHKLDIICQKLKLQSTDTVLEIGTGWGGFALYAAENYGCKVVTTTISQQQYDLAKQRIVDKKLEHQITLLNKDYRHLTGTYDKIVSIEMIEAVGHQYYNTFFANCSALLKPRGQMLIQAITIQDQAFERAKNEVDFIKQSIFPGSCIPSVTALLAAMTRSSDLRLFHLEDIGLHYAKTLKLWRQRFSQNQEQVINLGFNNNFINLWNFYLCYCEAGFAEGYLGDMHLHFVKPGTIRAA
jgi:cyclopropane-fatty-acyl-phospholipid synthase